MGVNGCILVGLILFIATPFIVMVAVFLSQTFNLSPPGSLFYACIFVLYVLPNLIRWLFESWE